MSSPKPVKTKESSTVKFSNKTGGAYAEMKEVIESERRNWGTVKTPQDCKNTNGQKPPKR